MFSSLLGLTMGHDSILSSTSVILQSIATNEDATIFVETHQTPYQGFTTSTMVQVCTFNYWLNFAT
jgi:hypothetical protein